MNRIVNRIDQTTCSCVDCLTGYSVPLRYADDEQLMAMLAGHIENATGFERYEFKVTVQLPMEARNDIDEYNMGGMGW